MKISILIIGFSFCCLAQDERWFYTELIDPPKKTAAIDKINIPLTVEKTYQYDIDGDSIQDQLIVQKREGLDWIKVVCSTGAIFESKLQANGLNSHLYKARLVEIKPGTRLLILYFDEGFTHSTHFESSSRIYLLSFEILNKKFYLYKAPHIWHEKQNTRDRYWRRPYQVSVQDFNQDGTNDIAIHYHGIARIFFYKGLGQWERMPI